MSNNQYKTLIIGDNKRNIVTVMPDLYLVDRLKRFIPWGVGGVGTGMRAFDYDENNKLIGSHEVDAVVFSHNGLTTTFSKGSEEDWDSE